MRKKLELACQYRSCQQRYFINYSLDKLTLDLNLELAVCDYCNRPRLNPKLFWERVHAGAIRKCGLCDYWKYKFMLRAGVCGSCTEIRRRSNTAEAEKVIINTNG